MGYDEVDRILHEEKGWSEFAHPAPGPVGTALAAGMTVEEAVSRLHGAVTSLMESRFYPSVWQASYSLFVDGVEFWGLKTSLALGLQVEAPVRNIGPARTVKEWLHHMDLGYNRLGDLDENCAPWTEQGQLRRAAAKVPPPEWVGHEGIWELAILSGQIEVGLKGFNVAYANDSPTIREVRGLDAQQYLDNLRGLDAGLGRDEAHPLPWKPAKPLSKVPA